MSLSLRSSPCCAQLTVWSTVCGGRVKTPTVTRYPTSQPSETYWGPLYSPLPFSCCGAVATQAVYRFKTRACLRKNKHNLTSVISKLFIRFIYFFSTVFFATFILIYVVAVSSCSVSTVYSSDFQTGEPISF